MFLLVDEIGMVALIQSIGAVMVEVIVGGVSELMIIIGKLIAIGELSIIGKLSVTGNFVCFFLKPELGKILWTIGNWLVKGGKWSNWWLNVLKLSRELVGRL